MKNSRKDHKLLSLHSFCSYYVGLYYHYNERHIYRFINVYYTDYILRFKLLKFILQQNKIR